MPLAASDTHILTPLFWPLSKIIKVSKRFVPTVPMILSFKVLKYFLVVKPVSFYLLPASWW